MTVKQLHRSDVDHLYTKHTEPAFKLQSVAPWTNVFIYKHGNNGITVVKITELLKCHPTCWDLEMIYLETSQDNLSRKDDILSRMSLSRAVIRSSSIHLNSTRQERDVWNRPITKSKFRQQFDWKLSHLRNFVSVVFLILFRQQKTI